jgi:thiol-disulfide isomerase/thioredoxin
MRKIINKPDVEGLSVSALQATVAVSLLLTAGLIAFPAQPVELIGPLTREAILEALPEWAHEAAAYLPDPEIVARFHDFDRPIVIRVVIGTWCPDCRRHLTAFFRLIELADNPVISVEYFGVSRDKLQPEDIVRDNRIERVPTFIVLEEGREIGRITEHPRTTIESDLADIIFEDAGRPKS